MVTVGELITRARVILQEVSRNGTRWTNAELLDWINESYSTIVDIRPAANVETFDLKCQAGTRQVLPFDAERLIDVIRNTASSSSGSVVTKTLRQTLDSTRRGWHVEPETETIENFMFDEGDPLGFWVYPPASTAASLEVLYSKVPTRHSPQHDDPDSVDPIRLPDTFAPIMLDLVLHRAFSKDSESAANAQRSLTHLRSAQAALGIKVQSDSGMNLNIDWSGNPPPAQGGQP